MIEEPRTLAEMIDRLENYYDFQCEAGPLRNCVEWQSLKRIPLSELLPGLREAARLCVASDERAARIPIDLRIKARIKEIERKTP